MKLLTYAINKKELTGVLNREGTFVYPLSAAGMEYRTMKEVIREIGPSELELLDHISGLPPYEVSNAAPLEDIKNRSTDPGDVIPSHKDLTSQLDYEAELAVILKMDAKDVALEDVEDYIFGYTIMNDVSAREVQTAHRQWYFGKSLDGFTPLGPWIVTADSVEFPPKLKIQSWVNGELRQDSNTDQFIHGIAEVVSELSRGMTLKAGTIIATGTPAGVGMGFDPPRFLKPGDVVECMIEGIGTLKNPVVE